MNCLIRTEKKYLKRPSPPISANDCKVNTIKQGNDGNMYQIVEVKGKSGPIKRWVKCGTGKSDCSKKLVKSKKSKVKECPDGKVINPKTGRCVKIKVVSKKTSKEKKCPVGKIINPKTGRCIKMKIVSKKNNLNECPKGKVINPKTGRCVKMKIVPIHLSKKPLKSKTPKIAKTPVSNSILWDVKRQGVMLAHTYKDSKSGKVTNPPPGTPMPPNGWFISEKFDGYRAIWNGQNFVSRNGNIFHAPESFKKWMPNDIALDGELFIGRELFEKHGIIRQKNPPPNSWDKAGVQFQIFDSPTLSGGFEIRYKSLEKLVKELCKKSKNCPLRMVKQKKIKDEKEMYKIFDSLTSKGAEGVMIRAPGSPYDPKRSRYLLKVKQLFDEECKIIGYQSGSGKYNRMLGAFKCRLMKNPDIEFTISGMDDKIRKNYKKTHPLGTIVTFTYMGLSAKGVPRHPNYLRIRN